MGLKLEGWAPSNNTRCVRYLEPHDPGAEHSSMVCRILALHTFHFMLSYVVALPHRCQELTLAHPNTTHH